jgi:hypothetical protein
MSVLETWALALAAPAPAQDERLSLHLVDTVGAWIAGAGSAEGREIAGSREGKLALLGDGPLDRLALAVATTRLTEIDDIHRASCVTAGAVVIPTGVIMARALGATSAPFAQALRNGYETMMRLGVGVNGPGVLARGVWPRSPLTGFRPSGARGLGFRHKLPSRQRTASPRRARNSLM